MQVEQIFREEKRGKRMLSDERLLRPRLDQHRRGIQVIAQAGLHRRQGERRVPENIGNAQLLALHPPQVRGVADEMRQQVHRLPWGAWHRPTRRSARPEGKLLLPLADAQAIAEIVAQHDIKRRQHRLHQEFFHAPQPTLPLGAGRADRDRHEVLHIAMQNKLIRRVALIQGNQFGRPGRQSRSRHFGAKGWNGGSKHRFSTGDKP